MTDEATRKKCQCPVCVYGRKVRDLIHRTPDEADKKLIEKLYDDLIHAEDDRDFNSIRSEACRIKHGGITFTDAVMAVNDRREKLEAEGKAKEKQS